MIKAKGKHVTFIEIKISHLKCELHRKNSKTIQKLF